MPNWCMNTLVIRGRPSELDALSERLADEAERHEGKHLTFQSFVPHDATVATGSTGSGWFGRRKDTGAWESMRQVEVPGWQPGDEGPRYQNDPEHAAQMSEVDCISFVTLADGTILTEAEARAAGIRSWYDWNVENWGTKWDACHVDVDFTNLDEGTLVYRFDTAWTPPIPVVQAMQAALPNMRIRLHGIEPGEGFQVFVYPDGRDETLDYRDADYFLDNPDEDFDDLDYDPDPYEEVDA